jgi:hypothetical protein
MLPTLRTFDEKKKYMQTDTSDLEKHEVEFYFTHL